LGARFRHDANLHKKNAAMIHRQGLTKNAAGVACWFPLSSGASQKVTA